MKNSTYIEKKWMQFKVSTLSASMTAFILASIPTHISAADIDIYQAGGTGDINIYFMLDASGSMGSGSIGTDYKRTSSKKLSVTKYIQSNSGNKYLTQANNVGYGNGEYIKDGKNYFKVEGGNYNITLVTYDSKKHTEKSQRYNESKNQEFQYKICQSNSELTTREFKTDNGLVFAPIGDPHCVVNTNSSLWDSDKDENHLEKIKAICENYPKGSTIYYCFTRLTNLRKGLVQLVSDPSIGKDHNFALGYYPKTAGVRGAKTSLNFTNMESAENKTKFLEELANIKTTQGTPITWGYDEAATQLQTYAGNPGNTSAQCSGNGIYLLTDGEPTDTSDLPSNIKNLNVTVNEDTYWANSTTNKDRYNNITGYDDNANYWRKFAKYVISLKESNYKIKTATVGLGGGFFTSGDYAKDGKYVCSEITGSGNAGYDKHHQDLCYIGTKLKANGEGGFYNAQSAEDVKNSIEQFVKDVSVPIEGSTMGTSTIPVDALNTTQLQPYSYFPMFKPLINTDDQLWAGNLKKFKVDTTTGTIIDKKNNTVFDVDNIRASLEDYWYESGGSSNDDTKMAWGGLLSKLKVHHKPTLLSNGNVSLNRELYINQQDGQLKKVTEVLNATSKPTNSQYLYGLLGYSKLTKDDFTQLSTGSYSDQLNYLKNKAASQNYQMGSVIHSTPIMLTQEGSFGYDGDNYVSKGRKDYILAGTTQGLVQVVDAESGKEVFSFLPSEFLNGASNQAKGFAESLAMDRRADTSKDQFFYGVDGPWVAHTEYKNKFDVTTDVVTNESIEVESLVASKQYVYGGLRMGGKSYYGLDLTKLGNNSGEKPSMLFHIDPANAGVGTPLSYMGQSWSKPTVTYIRWNGQKKLAMIVGGGYDPKYEDPAFVNNASVEGNGIYIFDALNGDLLWWGSSDATTGKQLTLTSNKTAKFDSTNISDLKNSIPSSIKAIDRDGDGITDHLYTGDLGGQVFRVDLNPEHKVSTESSDQKPLVLNAFKFADVNEAGKNPRRFYEPPTFTIHKDGGKRFAVLALSSGDRSSPLKTATNASPDIIVALEDHGVTQNSPVQQNIGFSQLHNLSGNFIRATTAKGWYFPTEIAETRIKDNKSETVILKLRGFEPGIALDNDLYFSLFNPEETTANTENVTSCTGGIIGESIAYKFCLPYGTCSATVKGPVKVGSLGPGILGLTLGPGRSAETNRTLIFNKQTSPLPTEYTVTDKLVPRRWFEYLPYKSGN